MNMGFFGIQFSFGITQTAMSPLFSAMGATAHNLPAMLWVKAPSQTDHSEIVPLGGSGDHASQVYDRVVGSDGSYGRSARPAGHGLCLR